MAILPGAPATHRLLPTSPGVLLTLALAATAAVGQVPPSGPRTNHAVGVYDAALGRVVLIGGAEQPRATARDQVWSWTGMRWDLLTDSGPPARGNAAAAYDAGRRAVVVAGGAQQSADASSFEILGDTWEGTAAGWRRMAGTSFEPRDHLSLMYDEGRGAVLMFGGIPGDRSAAWPSDTWELRQRGWVRIATEGPAGRARAALAYDGARRQVVLFGGVGAERAPGQPQPFFGDTWVWEGTAWRQVATGGPPARYAHGMVYDERAGVVLLYSGAAAHRDGELTDMWQWDGVRWTEIHLSGPTPGFRYQPVMVYDRARGKTVLYGGIGASGSETWEWDGRRWSAVDP